MALLSSVLSSTFQGLQGPAGTIQVGSVTTLAPGSNATVTNSGTSTEAIFDFGIPQGVPGGEGLTSSDAAALAIALG